MLSDALVSLEATAAMTPGNRLLTLSHTEAASDRDGGVEVWMEGLEGRGCACDGKRQETRKKQQASNSQSPPILSSVTTLSLSFLSCSLFFKSYTFMSSPSIHTSSVSDLLRLALRLFPLKFFPSLAACLR